MFSDLFEKMDKNYAFRFERIADFLLPRNGESLDVFTWPETDRWALDFVLSRGVIPRLLHLKGIACLHASAVQVGEGTVGFLGWSGSGKSTLAAALVARGFPLVSDDVLPLRIAPGREEIFAGPGLPELRLTPSSAQMVGVAEAVSAPSPGQTKGRWNPAAHQVAEDPLSLSCLYSLEPSSRSPRNSHATFSEPIGSRMEVLLMSLRNSFWVDSRETQALARTLPQFGLLCRSVPVRRLSFEFTARSLQAAEQVIRRDLNYSS